MFFNVNNFISISVNGPSETIVRLWGWSQLQTGVQPHVNFVSEATERVIATQLLEYLVLDDLHEIYQSAYITALIPPICRSFARLITRPVNSLRHGRPWDITVTPPWSSRNAAPTCVIAVSLSLSTMWGLQDLLPGGWSLGYLRNLFSKLSFLWCNSTLGDILHEQGISYHTYADEKQLFASFRPG